MKKNGISRRDWVIGTGATAALGAIPIAAGATAPMDHALTHRALASAKSTSAADESDRARRMKWWHEARFGMFIHWGLYSVLGRHEWVMENEGIPVAEYAPLGKQFKPKPNAARAWAKLAKPAGHEDVGMTTKHPEALRT